MAKRDCNRKGYLKGSVRSRIVCKKQLISIEKTAKDKKEIRKPQLGPRALAWNEFKKSGEYARLKNDTKDEYTILGEERVYAGCVYSDDAAYSDTYSEDALYDVEA